MAGKLCISETLYTGEAQRSNILILEISDTCITYLTLGKDSKKTVFLTGLPSRAYAWPPRPCHGGQHAARAVDLHLSQVKHMSVFVKIVLQMR